MNRLSEKLNLVRGIDQIRARLERSDTRLFCDDTIAAALEPGDLEAIEREVCVACEGVLRALLIDVDRDPHTKETASRMAKMYVRELFVGRYEAMPQLKSFPAPQDRVEPYIIGPIAIRSTCAHHFQAIAGEAWIVVDEPRMLLGLSKFHRLAEWVAARPSVQETLTQTLAALVETEAAAKGVLVCIEASHGCLTHRGVQAHDGRMETVAVRGSLDQADERREAWSRLAVLRKR